MENIKKLHCFEEAIENYNDIENIEVKKVKFLQETIIC